MPADNYLLHEDMYNLASIFKVKYNSGDRSFYGNSESLLDIAAILDEKDLSYSIRGRKLYVGVRDWMGDTSDMKEEGVLSSDLSRIDFRNFIDKRES